MAKARQTPRKLKQNQQTTTQEGSSRLGSIYDKILKENFDESIKTLIQHIDGLQIIKFTPLRTKMQHTKENDPDELTLVWLRDGTQRILHAELHLKDEYAINCRFCEYHIMLKRKKRVPKMVQYVIYIGTENPKHITGVWVTESLTFRYNVIILKNIPYQIFLEADNPETVVLSILADFQGEDAEFIGQKIADRVTELSETHMEKEKFFAQLRILSKARKLQPIIEKIMTNIYKLIDITDDPLYVDGIIKGKTEGKIEGKIESIESLMINTDFDDEAIARYLSVPLELVIKTRQNLYKK